MYEITLYILVVISIALLFFMHKKNEEKEIAQEKEEEEKKLEKSFFIDHGNVKWHLVYTTDLSDADGYIIENIPYCKKCGTKYNCTPDSAKQGINLECSKCRDKKRSYPLTLNYHTVQNIAEEKIAKLRKQFLPGK